MTEQQYSYYFVSQSTILTLFPDVLTFRVFIIIWLKMCSKLDCFHFLISKASNISSYLNFYKILRD